jgi:hypothetical protein
MTTLLRVLLLINRPARLARSGFVLPTTALLVLMVLLTATALTYRAFTRSDQAITQREQLVIANSATPAIDRAKSKMEFMFQSDPRFPSSGVPASDVLSDLMAKDGYTGTINPLTGGDDDPYTFPDESRLDINGDGSLDNAWSFQSNGETIVYSILVDDEGPQQETTVSLKDPFDEDTNNDGFSDKARALVTRTGPLATTEATATCANAQAESGWQVVATSSSSTLQKNFQVNVFVANENDANKTFETFEFQQSRISSRANKWAAWFRYDLDIFPGPDFNLNGAMHTDGNLVVRSNPTDSNNQFISYMISSHNSCLYSKQASEVTVGAEIDYTDDDNNVVDTFQGQVIKGSIVEDDNDGGNPIFHIWDGDNDPPIDDTELTNGTDSVIKSGNANYRVSDVAMNPLALFTRDEARHIDKSTWERDTDNWDDASPFVAGERIYNDEVDRPFVDDFFRADDRWGPKPRYKANDDTLDITKRSDVLVGDPITSNDTLTNPTNGLDGFWERQAIDYGFRVIVGERLELGNANGWNYDPLTDSTVENSDPLYPPNASYTKDDGGDADATGVNEWLQQKTLRDNLAAVQSMAVYHYEGGGMATDGTFPMACYALTAHPGTPETIIDSRTFSLYDNIDDTGDGNPDRLKTDFLTGNGTNGWEFKYHDDFDTPAEFDDAVVLGQPLGNALYNLAYFAGDPNGGAPSFRPVQDSNIHPYPYQSMWGDFSALRRIIENGGLGSTASYNALSFADKSTVHTAACTISMLAYNLKAENEELLAYLSSENLGITDFSTITTNLRTTLLQIVNYMADGTIATSPGGTTTDAMFTSLGRTTTWVDPNVNTAACASDTTGFEKACDIGEYLSEYTRDDWRIVLEEGAGAGLADIDTIFAFADTVNGLSQSIRDRDLGFHAGVPINSLAPATAPPNEVSWNTSEPFYTEAITLNTESHPLKVACNPNLFGEVVNNGSGDKNDLAAFALVVCSDPGNLQVKYPALYYLFPVNKHDHFGKDAAGGDTYHLQPNSEEYVADSYLGDATDGVNRSVFYEVVGSDSITGISDIAALPKSTDFTSAPAWVLPHGAAATGTLSAASLDNGQEFTIQVGSDIADVAMLDKVMLEGRERMAIRVLDMDIARLTTDTNIADTWISSLENGISNPICIEGDTTPDVFEPDNPICNVYSEGVVYAFREDAVREDEIIRPRDSTLPDTNPEDPANYCQAIDKDEYPLLFALEHDSQCRMTIDPGSNSYQDPPLTEDLISLKPVDFIADPFRRPYGFRFRNGEDFSGTNRARRIGMSFITDNSVYILGNFNIHSSSGTTTAANLLEEFTDLMSTKTMDEFTPANFYDNRLQTELDLDSFADFDVDHWRPVEILADAIGILSESFNDGAAIDTFTKATPGSSNGADSSFTNISRPIYSADRPDNTWLHEALGDNTSPIWLDRNGVYYRNGYDYPAFGEVTVTVAGDPNSPYIYKGRPIADGVTYRGVAVAPVFTADGGWMSIYDTVEDRNTNIQGVDDTNTYVNAVFVSGIVPRRPRQSYGGLHNFPRFNEGWNDQNLHIMGSFIQLNFSTAATGPFEHEAWEPGEAPTESDQGLGYYRPPIRRWGYDVALLYVPPSPVARRFVDIESPRSEYFRQVAADDPYIVNLRCARYDPNDGDSPDTYLLDGDLRPGVCQN